MNPFPISIPNSRIHFALRGRLVSGFELLVMSKGCPVALRNAMPINSAGQTSGRLARIWLNALARDYNWAYSESLPQIELPRDTSADGEVNLVKMEGNDFDTNFRPQSRLQFAWRAYGSKSLRSRVKKQLDRQSLDLCKAILANDEIAVANALAPIILECEGYSTGV